MIIVISLMNGIIMNLIADLTTDESVTPQSPHNCPLPVPVKKLSNIVSMTHAS